jgi:hypothetical protein
VYRRIIIYEFVNMGNNLATSLIYKKEEEIFSRGKILGD